MSRQDTIPDPEVPSPRPIVREQIRAVEGPLAGAVFVLRGPRTRLGRASDSDVQIVHDGVSRHHAQIIRDGSGAPVLVDLSSNNGTFVGNRRIVRHPLRPGDEFRILRARFLFEQTVEPGDDRGGQVYAVNVTSAETLRQTVDHWDLDLPEFTRANATRFRVPTELRPAPQLVQEPGPARHAVVAVGADGANYEGDILADITNYRSLRIRKLTDGLDEGDDTDFDQLEAALRQPPDGEDRRLFARFRCKFPARLRHGGQTGEHTSRAAVIDVGAGGARIDAFGTHLDEGDLAWLVIDLVVRDRPRTIVFTSRVVRIAGQQLGLMFAGAPEWEIWRRRRSRRAT